MMLLSSLGSSFPSLQQKNVVSSKTVQTPYFSTQSTLAQPQFGMMPIKMPSGAEIFAAIAALTAVVGLTGAGIGYWIAQGSSKKEPETIQTPGKPTHNEVKDIQQ